MSTELTLGYDGELPEILRQAGPRAAFAAEEFAFPGRMRPGKTAAESVEAGYGPLQ